MEAFQHHVLPDARFFHEQIIDIEIVIVLGIGDCGLEHLLHLPRHALLREAEFVQRRFRPQAADRLRNKIELARGDADVRADGLRLGIGQNARACFLAHYSALFAFLSPE